MGNNIFSIATLFFSVLLLLVYFSKKRVQSFETKIYDFIVIVNLITNIFAVMCYYTILYKETVPLINFFVSKTLLICYFEWIMLFTVYMIGASRKTDESALKRIIPINLIIGTMVMIAVYLLPLYYYNENRIAYSYGPSANIVFMLAGVMVFVWAYLILKNIRQLKNKQFYPLFAMLVLGIFVIIIQKTRPEFLLLTALIAFVTFIMYFTIENPDIKLVKAMELAKDQAEQANHAKTDFLSSMSHEIRTPLNAIVGFSDEIMESDTLEEAKANAKDIVNASQTLLEIVNGILDISKIEAGKLEIVNSSYNAPEVFEELAKLITPKMVEKGLDFTYTIAPDLPKCLYGDHANLKKIVTNLLSNACKYTERGFVHYEVSCVNTGKVSKLIISVEDSGRGIKRDSIDKLFTKFQRLDEDKNTTIEGTGLGLAITKQLAELMGGQIIVHTVYGSGSKFTVVLNQRIEEVKGEKEKKVKSTLDLTGIRILLVDDNDLNLKVATKLLERHHANDIVTCKNGFECIERIQNKEEYDFILLDDMMPKMSGVQTLQKLKEIPGFKTPVIALTANAITGMREKYLQDGFDDYLAKPIEKEQLIQVINQILGRSSTEELPTEEIQEAAKEEPEKEVDLIPVVDIDVPEEEKESKYDVSYLEENGVDIAHALELLGDMDMFNDTISEFAKEVEEKWNHILEYKEQGDMENYAIDVHSLKSDCKYLGLMSLADIAYEHELKSKENDKTFVEEHFKELEEEFEKVLEIVKNYVS